MFIFKSFGPIIFFKNRNRFKFPSYVDSMPDHEYPMWLKAAEQDNLGLQQDSRSFSKST